MANSSLLGPPILFQGKFHSSHTGLNPVPGVPCNHHRTGLIRVCWIHVLDYTIMTLFESPKCEKDKSQAYLGE